ncbi:MULTISPECIES: phosphonate ABC transporter, permease protein PhnE [unclassified Sphingomonas]|uniref:phosphonate ABC transporter, permease protein PhnE n=1 Tax=unclassified Sphingomonas TaxID=196159 RepID=UPI0003117EEC|nr:MULTISPECIES: phosphonate ABC transporter, permease protein PhnE [unclassified Sphingomonas]
MSTPDLSSPAPTPAFPRPFGRQEGWMALCALLLLLVSGHRMGIDRMSAMTGQAAVASVTGRDDSQVLRGLSTLARRMVPIALATREEAARRPDIDPEHLPWGMHLEVETRKGERLNPETLRLEAHPVRVAMLVRPYGYVAEVAAKMLETIEIALWGTIIALALGLPLALLGATNMAAPAPFRIAAHMVVAAFRAMPELVSALFLVVAYGFGPIAGILALGLYAAGFIGKFFADDMENADPGPQRALIAGGAGRLAVWRFAILPQVMPQFIAYTLYILDRNIRMATVVGLVGAGGIGQELKGRYDLYEYGHVATILIAIFLVVLALDQLSVRLRRHVL